MASQSVRMTRDLLTRHAWSIAAAVVVLAVLAGSLRAMPRHVFWSPDEGGKFFALSSIEWDGGIIFAVPYVGRGIDPGLRFFPRGQNQPRSAFPYPVTTAEGTVRFHWPLWFPLVSRPLFEAFGITGIYLLPLLSGWLIAVISGRIAYALAPHLAPAAIVIVGLATPVWFYSLTFWEHTLAACAGLLALAVLVAGHSAPGVATAPVSYGGRRVLFAMLGPLFVAVLLRIEMVAFGAAAILTWALAARRAAIAPDMGSAPSGVVHRRRAWVVAALAAALAGLVWFVSASILAPRQVDFVASVPRRIAASVHNLSALPRSAVAIFVSTARDEGPVVAPGWVAAATLALVLCCLAPFVGSIWIEACILIPALVVMLAFSGWLLVLGQSYRSLHGLFSVAPFTVFWLYALADARRGEWRLRTLALFALVYLAIAYAMLFVLRVDRGGDVTGGLEWGSRYILALYPVLAVLAVAAVDSYARSSRPAWLRVAVTSVAACMVLVALYLEIRGVTMLRANRKLFATWDRALQSEQPIVTDVWWLPTTLAPLFVTRETYFVRGREEVLAWRALAAARGEKGVTLAAFGRPREDAMGPGLCRVPERSSVVAGLHLVRYEPCGAPGDRLQ